MADPALAAGDRLPFAYGMDEAQRYWSFEDQAGRASVLVLAGDAPPSAVAEVMEALSSQSEALALLGAEVRVLALAGAPGWATAVVPSDVRVAHVMETGLFAAAAAPAVVIADRAMRLVARFELRGAAERLGEMLGVLEALSRPPAREVRTPAPVLVVPHVLSPDACARLIARFETGGHVEGAMASVDGDGVAINRIDAAKKHRRDLSLDPADPLHAEVVAALSTRLVPEIRKAFQVDLAHLDRILVARYDASGGYFRRHRDNSAAHLAWREFALSLNLNTGAYEGGELVFPEYSDDRHAPPAGAAAIFSASLLHEALPVLRGRRYVLLSFLHSHAAEARRQAAVTRA